MTVPFAYLPMEYGLFLLFAAFVLRNYVLKGVTVKAWQDFIDSLATAGGNIVTLFCCSVMAGLLWIKVYTQYHDNTDAVMGTFGIFTGFTGALLQAQKGNSSRQQMQDRIDTTRPTPTPAPSPVTAERVTTLNVNQSPTPAPAPPPAIAAEPLENK